MTIKIRTRKSNATEEWAMKEAGSWDDNHNDPNHPCALLQDWGRTMFLTKQQIEDLIKSGEYHATAWNDDEIDGGRRTKEVIKKWVNILKQKLEHEQERNA